MMKIYPRINAAIGATMDRIDVRKLSGKTLIREDDIFYKNLVNESGVSSNNPLKMIRNWKKAYSANLRKNILIYNLNKQMGCNKSFLERLGLK